MNDVFEVDMVIYSYTQTQILPVILIIACFGIVGSAILTAIIVENIKTIKRIRAERALEGTTRVYKLDIKFLLISICALFFIGFIFYNVWTGLLADPVSNIHAQVWRKYETVSGEAVIEDVYVDPYDQGETFMVKLSIDGKSLSFANEFNKEEYTLLKNNLSDLTLTYLPVNKYGAEPWYDEEGEVVWEANYTLLIIRSNTGG